MVVVCSLLKGDDEVRKEEEEECEDGDPPLYMMKR